MDHRFSWVQRNTILKFHPKSIFINVVGMIWFTYFLWLHDWKSAVSMLIVTKALARLTVMNIDVEDLSETLLGKIALLHLQPMNLVLQTFGVLVYLAGVWMHSTQILLIGISGIFLGHIAGWGKVDERLMGREF
jgi:hypothetical protein